MPLWFRIASAMIDRAELPVQRNRTLYRFAIGAAPSMPSVLCGTAIGPATGRLLCCANEGTHELSVHLRSNAVDVNSRLGQKLPRILHVVNSRGFNRHI